MPRAIYREATTASAGDDSWGSNNIPGVSLALSPGLVATVSGHWLGGASHLLLKGLGGLWGSICSQTPSSSLPGLQSVRKAQQAEGACRGGRGKGLASSGDLVLGGWVFGVDFNLGPFTQQQS